MTLEFYFMNAPEEEQGGDGCAVYDPDAEQLGLDSCGD